MNRTSKLRADYISRQFLKTFKLGLGVSQVAYPISSRKSFLDTRILRFFFLLKRYKSKTIDQNAMNDANMNQLNCRIHLKRLSI